MGTKDYATIIISSIALIISAFNLWLTVLRRGKIRMVHPPLITFTRDGPGGPQKVVLRSLLFSTGNRGNLVESMYVILSKDGKRWEYPIWNCAENSPNSAVPGGGLFIGRDGASYYQHFLSLDGEACVSFEPGLYHLEVFATVLGRRRPHLLRAVDLYVPELVSPTQSLRYDWNPVSKKYHPEIK
jgi:hypothetical protein